MEQKLTLFKKWHLTLERNFVLHFPRSNIPGLSAKYFVLFIHKLPDKGQTHLLSNLCMATAQPKTSQLLCSLSYSSLGWNLQGCRVNTEQNEDLTPASAQVTKTLTKRLTVSLHDIAMYSMQHLYCKPNHFGLVTRSFCHGKFVKTKDELWWI